MPDVTFAGQQFKTADRIGHMAVMRFAKAAKSGVDSESLDGLAAMYDLLHQCIDPADWSRFEAAADDARSEADELMEVVKQVMETIAERPTSRPSDSSGGPTTTAPSSTDASSGRVIRRLEAQGRPDLALMVVQANSA